MSLRFEGSFLAVVSQLSLIEISKNDEYDEVAKHKKAGFLFFPYYLEINALLHIDYDVYVQQLKNLIKFLRSKGMRAVPACNFEDELNDGKSYTEFMK